MQKEAVEGNDPHGRHGGVSEGDWARVGVSRGWYRSNYCVLGGCLLSLICVEGVSKICLTFWRRNDFF